MSQTTTNEFNNTEPTTSPEQGVPQFIDVHVYRGTGPEDEAPLSSEWVTAAPKPMRSYRTHTLILLAIGVGCGLSLIAGYLVYVLFYAPVTVTIVPKSQKVVSSVTVTIATAAPITNSIPGRALPSLTMSQTLTLATTGQTFQPAQPGQGTITFYNSALYPQTIVAGTLIQGRDGAQVVTDAAVTVPAGTLATNGQATVTAHTLIDGPQGDIAAGDIYGPCCLLNIEASNSAFSGGVEAHTYQSVAQHDIDTATEKLQTNLNQEVLAAFQAQLLPSETLVTPPVCRPTVSTDHQVGDEATQIQVTDSLTCTGLTYNTQAFQQRISQMQAPTHYQLEGVAQTTLQSVSSGNDPGTDVLTVQCTALWSYQFTNRELTTIANHIKGMDTLHATQYLLHTAGIQQVSLSKDGYLPTNSSQIHFLFLTQEE